MTLPAKPLSYADAMATVRDRAEQPGLQPRGAETLELLSARGRVLAQPVLADRDQPPFARSTRDGFAGRAEEWLRGGLAVAGLLRAGESWNEPLGESGGGSQSESLSGSQSGSRGEPVGAGCCIEIMTGAPLPAGLDCVVMIEHIERDGGTVRLAAGRAIAAGDNVVPQGAEARQDAVLLPAGTRLSAHGIAVAAACGYARVEVYTRPRVAILSTGDELVDVGETPRTHQIRNSNTYTLAAQVEALGGEALLLPPVADEAQALEAAIREASRSCELLLLSGGVSMGKYDLVEPALAGLGGVFHFTGARIQPGKPIVFGELESTGLPFFGLPGNPVSTIVCFAVLVAPLLAALCGQDMYTPPFAQARLRHDYRGKAGLTRFLPALLTHDIAVPSVEVIAWQGSGDLASTARANCFLVVPEETAGLAAGTTVTVLLA